jgi:mono/diheme cytochrome c family protein
MYRTSVPFALLGAVAAATFGLAKWHPFAPSAPGGGTPAAGDVARGEGIFSANCASCHGANATGGAGPPLRGSSLTAAEVQAVVATGGGIMPAGIVAGQDAADVAAYVASIAE